MGAHTNNPRKSKLKDTLDRIEEKRDTLKKCAKPPQSLYMRIRKYIFNNKPLGANLSISSLREELIQHEELELARSQVQTVLDRMKINGHLIHPEYNCYRFISREINSKFTKKEITDAFKTPTDELSSYFWLLGSTRDKYSYESIREPNHEKIWMHTILKIWKASQQIYNVSIPASMSFGCVITTRVRSFSQGD